jgi:hypothetical protein
LIAGNLARSGRDAAGHEEEAPGDSSGRAVLANLWDAHVVKLPQSLAAKLDVAVEHEAFFDVGVFMVWKSRARIKLYEQRLSPARLAEGGLAVWPRDRLRQR